MGEQQLRKSRMTSLSAVQSATRCIAIGFRARVYNALCLFGNLTEQDFVFPLVRYLKGSSAGDHTFCHEVLGRTVPISSRKECQSVEE